MCAVTSAHGKADALSVLLSVIFVSGRDDLRRGIPFGVLFRSFEFGAFNLFGIWDLELVSLRLRRSGKSVDTSVLPFPQRFDMP